ncbi:MAG: NblA/ycf18 family protein [Heteroscytonema crispum UTEX LB 1556]
MNQPIKLSLEQEFSIRSFADQVQQMSREQAQEFCALLYKQMLVKDATYQQLLRHQWSLDSGAVSG